MARIIVESEVLNGMAGEVRYFTKPCPFGVIGIGGGVTMVGSTSCAMCPHHGGLVAVTETEEIECAYGNGF